MNHLDRLIAGAERFTFEGEEHGHGLPQTFRAMLAALKAATGPQYVLAGDILAAMNAAAEEAGK